PKRVPVSTSMNELFGRSPGAAEGTVTKVRALGSLLFAIAAPEPQKRAHETRVASIATARLSSRGRRRGASVTEDVARRQPRKRLTYRAVRLQCAAPPAREADVAGMRF